MTTRLRLLLLPGLLGAVAVSPFLRADSGDVNGSRDYPGLPRIPGFVITDYNEDNSAVFDFPVAHPLSVDADHVDTLRVKGHRYVIRYETGQGMQAPSLLQTQQYYEKLAVSEGFAVAKSGATHDVTETFHLSKAGHDLWVYLDPAVTINILTIVEGRGEVLPPVVSVPPPPPPPLPSPVPPPVPLPDPLPLPVDGLPDAAPDTTPDPEPTQRSFESKPATAPVPRLEPASEPVPTVSDDSLYFALKEKDRVALPVTFLPGQPDLDVDSAPVIVSVIAMLQKHPELRLEIDGYTDSIGDPQHNRSLSAQRAATVRNLLVEGHIEKSRLATAGMGGSQPVADNSTAEGREKNRRIELAVLREPPPAPVLVQQTSEVEPAPRQAPPQDSATDDSSGFHNAAPNGVNYYPTNN